MFCGLPLFGVMFLFLGSVELVHHEDQPFCSPRIWHLAGADPWVLLGIPSIRASHAFPVLTSLCFYVPSSLFHSCVCLFQDAPLFSSLSVTLCVSLWLIRSQREYFCSQILKNPQDPKAFTPLIFILSFLCTMENKFEKL